MNKTKKVKKAVWCKNAPGVPMESLAAHPDARGWSADDGGEGNDGYLGVMKGEEGDHVHVIDGTPCLCAGETSTSKYGPERKRNIEPGRSTSGKKLTRAERTILDRFFRPDPLATSAVGHIGGIDGYVAKYRSGEVAQVFAQVGNARSGKAEAIALDALDELVDKGVMVREAGGVWEASGYTVEVDVEYRLSRHWLNARLKRKGVGALIMAEPTGSGE